MYAVPCIFSYQLTNRSMQCTNPKGMHAQAAALRVCLAFLHPEAASDAEFLTNKEWGRPRKRKKPWMPTVPVGELQLPACGCRLRCIRPRAVWRC